MRANARDRNETGADDHVERHADRRLDEFARFDSLRDVNGNVFVDQIVGANRLRAHACDKAREQGKAARRVEIEPQAGEESLGWRGRRLYPRFDHVDELVAELLDRREEQLPVGSKVVAEGPAGHARRRDHVLDHRGVDPLFREHEQGAFDQLAPHARPPLRGDPGSVVVGDERFQHLGAPSGCDIRTHNNTRMTLASS